MRFAFSALIAYVASRFQSLRLENIAFRHQLFVYQRTVKRPELRPLDRLFWVWLSRLSYCERLIGSIRRDALDPIIVLNERHLRRVLTAYIAYYHRFRTHLSLEMDCPYPRAVEPPELDPVIAFPEVSGLHHHYERQLHDSR